MNTYFIASSDEAKLILKGWVFPPPPLEKPITIVVDTAFGTKRSVQTRLDRVSLRAADEDAVREPRLSSLKRVQNATVGLDQLPIAFSELARVPIEDAEDLIFRCGLLVGPRDGTLDIYRLPQGFLEVLASATTETFNAVAKKLGGVDSGELLEGLDELRVLASQGHSLKQDLYLALSFDD